MPKKDKKNNDTDFEVEYEESPKYSPPAGPQSLIPSNYTDAINKFRMSNSNESQEEVEDKKFRRNSMNNVKEKINFEINF